MEPTIIIRARFIEAAFVELHGSGGISLGRAAWPLYLHSEDDMKHWGTQRLKEHRDAFWRRRSAPPSSEALSRYEECLDWTIDLPEKHRAPTWGWAFSIAGKGNFREACRGLGISFVTGYDRVARAIDIISGTIRRKRIPLSNPDETIIERFARECGIRDGMIGKAPPDAGRVDDLRVYRPDEAVVDGGATFERARQRLADPEARLAASRKIIRQAPR